MNNSNELLLLSLKDFYSNENNFSMLLSIINGESKISLRLIDWFITNYCKNNKKQTMFYGAGKKCDVPLHCRNIFVQCAKYQNPHFDISIIFFWHFRALHGFFRALHEQFPCTARTLFVHCTESLRALHGISSCTARNFSVHCTERVPPRFWGLGASPCLDGGWTGQPH